MAHIKVYIFESIAHAEIAIDAINEVQNLPTRRVSAYCRWFAIEYNIVIYHDDVVESVLGDEWILLKFQSQKYNF